MGAWGAAPYPGILDHLEWGARFSGECRRWFQASCDNATPVYDGGIAVFQRFGVVRVKGPEFHQNGRDCTGGSARGAAGCFERDADFLFGQDRDEESFGTCFDCDFSVHGTHKIRARPGFAGHQFRVQAHCLMQACLG